jgi:hypothetical protein
MRVGITLLLVFSQYISSAQRPPMYLKDVFSTPYQTKPRAGIQGSPFLEDKWTLAQVKVEGSKQVIDSFHLKLNVYDNRIHFMSEKGIEMEATIRAEEIKIIDAASGYLDKIFLSSFDQEKGFFEVVAEGGKLKLLKRHRVFIAESKPLGMEPQKKFEPTIELFFSSGSVLYKANKSCTFVKEIFGTDKRVLDFISENNIRCNKEEDMKKLVAFVESLQ